MTSEGMITRQHDALWSAPFAPAHPLAACLSIPGSKSIMARALILAALSDSPAVIKNPLVSRDSELMRDGLRALGVRIEESPQQWRVIPASMTLPSESTTKSSEESSDDRSNEASAYTNDKKPAITTIKSIDVGNAGTVMRFLPAVAAQSHGTFSFDGDSRSHERPLAPLIKALEHLGVQIEHGGRYALPLTIHGAGPLEGGEIEIDASLSSQFVSSLLLAGSAMRHGLVIRDIGKSLPSLPHIEMTVSMLIAQGIEVETDFDENGGGRRYWKVAPRHRDISSEESTIEIEPDLSNAAPFLAAALLVGGEVAIKNWPARTTQPGDSLRRIFTTMGATFREDGTSLVISASGKRSGIKGIDIDLSNEGELTPTIAAVAAFASSPSHLRGIGHLRLHETDRLSALATELRKVGATVIEGSGDLHITPGDRLPSGPITISTYDDHRIATLGALVGLMIPHTQVENIATTRKTITDFPALWNQLLSPTEKVDGRSS